jgi:hypothetical protein
LTTTWTFTFTSALPIKAAVGSTQPDHILIKFPRDRFIDHGYPIFSRTGAISSNGQVYVIDIYDQNMIFYFVIITTQVAAGSPTSITLGNIRNPLEYTPGINLKLVYWNS